MKIQGFFGITRFFTFYYICIFKFGPKVTLWGIFGTFIVYWGAKTMQPFFLLKFVGRNAHMLPPSFIQTD